MASSTSSKRLSFGKGTNFTLCILCQKTGGELVKTPLLNSITKLLNCVKDRAGYGESGFLPINSRLQDASITELQENATWHRTCYQDAVHSGRIERAKQRYTKSLALLDTTIVTDVHKGRPVKNRTLTTDDHSEDAPHKPEYFTRSSTTPLSKAQCFFCNGDATIQDLHEVSSFRVGEKYVK